MPKKIIEDSEFSFKEETWEPVLPSVPLPPTMVKKQAAEKAAKKTAPKAAKRLAEAKLNEEYVNSEITKLNYLVENSMLQGASEGFAELKRRLRSRSIKGAERLREKFKYDLKRVETSIELLKI
jgi:hypothetical protein